MRAAAPDARLVVDANEAWTPEQVARLLPELARLGVELVEQPLPAGQDAALARASRAPCRCARTRAATTSEGLDALVGRYDYVNLKLDKTGGLTEALRAAAQGPGAGLRRDGRLHGGDQPRHGAGRAAGAGVARYVDLDGPLLLARDREPGLRYEGSLLHPPQAALWG